MTVSATAHGAGTIIAAFATGRGAAFGIDLSTTATVSLDGSGEVKGVIKGQPDESTLLVECCARRVFSRHGVDYGAAIETESTVPVARGLKSSSTAANAVVAALDAALREDGIATNACGLDLVALGIDAAFDAGVTVTGAFDDATASYFGGVSVTDNGARTVEARYEADELSVYLHVPPEKSYSGSVDVAKLKAFACDVDLLWREARDGCWHAPLTLNGLLHACYFGYDTAPAFDALDAGALAAGLSGKGPATLAVCAEEMREVRDALASYGGEVVSCKTNNETTRVHH